MTTASTTPSPLEETEYASHCKGEPRPGYDRYCREYEKQYPKATAAANRTTDQSSGDEPDSGPLAFTGLDVWQLVLVGLVLAAGGFGVRRLLAT